MNVGVLYGGGGGIWIIVLNKCATREMRKKGLFFEARCNSHESRFGGQNVPIFEKKVLLDYIKRRLGVIFQTPPYMSSKKACLE